MKQPQFIPAPAWRWLSGEVVDLSHFPGAQAVAAGLAGPDMAPSWRAWQKQINTELGWHLLCDFLVLLPWTYQPEDIAEAGRLRAAWAQVADDLQAVAMRAAELYRVALAMGLEPPLSDQDLGALDALAATVGEGDAQPVRADCDYLNAARASAQTFVQHFDSRWALCKTDHELWRVEMSHEDVARIGAATGLAYCTADAVRYARARKPTPADPHDPVRGVFVFRNHCNDDPDK